MNVKERGLIDNHQSGKGRIVHMVNPLAASGLASAKRPDAPALGADTDGILTDAGFDLEEIERLRAQGILGQPKGLKT